MEEKVEFTPIHRGMVEYVARNSDDDLERLGYFEMWENLYSAEDFKKILRIVTLARGRHLQLVAK